MFRIRYLTLLHEPHVFQWWGLHFNSITMKLNLYLLQYQLYRTRDDMRDLPLLKTFMQLNLLQFNSWPTFPTRTVFDAVSLILIRLHRNLASTYLNTYSNKRIHQIKNYYYYKRLVNENDHNSLCGPPSCPTPFSLPCHEL